jgi:hypothetical protein
MLSSAILTSNLLSVKLKNNYESSEFCMMYGTNDGGIAVSCLVSCGTVSHLTSLLIHCPSQITSTSCYPNVITTDSAHST